MHITMESYGPITLIKPRTAQYIIAMGWPIDGVAEAPIQRQYLEKTRQKTQLYMHTKSVTVIILFFIHNR